MRLLVSVRSAAEVAAGRRGRGGHRRRQGARTRLARPGESGRALREIARACRRPFRSASPWATRRWPTSRRRSPRLDGPVAGRDALYLKLGLAGAGRCWRRRALGVGGGRGGAADGAADGVIARRVCRSRRGRRALP